MGKAKGEKYPECPRLREEVSTLRSALCTESCRRIGGYKVHEALTDEGRQSEKDTAQMA